MNVSTEIPLRKIEIRKILVRRRLSIPDKKREEKNHLIFERLLEIPELENAEIVHIYIPIKEKKEVDTWPVITRLLEARKKVVVPVMEFDSVVLHHVYLKDIDDLKPNKWGVEEPEQRIPADVEALDIVLVPMIGGDTRGNRIGYGKGYYDSFLKKTHAVKIGLLFDECLIDEIPVESHDIRLDIMVTDKQVIRTANS